MKRIFLFFLFCAFFISGFGQTIQISGTVKDHVGDPLVGAGVMLKGTNQGVITDLDGKYQIAIPSSAKILVFSHMSTEIKEVEVNNRTVIDQILQPSATTLDDVVVVGYGTQKKATLTGAVASIKTAELAGRQGNVAQALQGKMSGVTIQQTSGQPGAADLSIKIRGLGSINSSQSPLVLVDGVEMEMNQVDPAMISSVSVLKDAASASIYGSKASNGVVLITTKRASAGKLMVSYSGYYGLQSATNLPETLSAVRHMEQVNIAQINGFSAPTYAQSLIDDYYKLGADQFNRYDTDWKKHVIKSGSPLQNHALTVSGGSEFLKYTGVVAYYNQDGLIDNNSYDRLSLRLNTDMTFTSWLTGRLDVDIRQGKIIEPSLNAPKAAIYHAFTLPANFSGINNDGSWGHGRNGVNPIASIADGGLKKTYNPESVISGTIFVKPFTSQVLKDFEWQTNYNMRTSNKQVSSFVRPYRTFENGVDKGEYPATSSGSENWSEVKQLNFRSQFSWSNTFNDRHYVKALIGFSSEEILERSFGGGRSDYKYKGYEWLGNGDPQTATNTGKGSEWAMLSTYMRLNYDYKSKYLFEVNGRYDGSSRFLKGNQWGFFPSFSAGWRITGEEFMKNIVAKNQISDIKVRASWGQLGNQAISTNYYPYASLIESNKNYWFGNQLVAGGAQISASNPDLSWETSTQTNIGLDLSLFKSRLNIVADWYIKDVSNMLLQLPIPDASGLKAPYENVGKMRNKGWELDIKWQDRIGDHFKYNVGLTLSDVQNKVLDVRGQEQLGKLQVGYALDSYYGLRSQGYFQSAEEINNAPDQYGLKSRTIPGFVKYLDLNGDKKINDDDREIIGNPFPRYEYGISLGAEFKGFDVSFFFQGVGKRDVMLLGQGIQPFLVGSSIFEHQLDYWTPDNRNALYPILLSDQNATASGNYRISDHWVKNGSYLRLKNMIVGYALPKSVLSKIKIDYVRFYISGQNLFTLDRFYKGFDPEVSVEGGTYGGQFYPISRTFSVGLDIRF